MDRIDIADQFFVPQSLVVQPNLAHLFKDRRVAFTKQKDNDLAWIVDWAHFYVACHGADAVLLYDNASTRYTPEEIHDALVKIPGLMQVVVVPWPYPHGVTGKTNFCQAVMLEHARRRFLAAAKSAVNADIDELALFDNEMSIFDAVEASETGYIQALGLYISNATHAAADRRRHRDFTELVLDAQPSPPKWAVVPKRCPDLAAWRPHFIADFERSETPGNLQFRHFRAINTNWLEARWHPGVRPTDGAAHDQFWRNQIENIPWLEFEDKNFIYES